MTPQEVIALLDNPEALLRRCALVIGGGEGPTGANGAATVQTFRVAVEDHQRIALNNGQVRHIGVLRGFTTGLSGLLGRRKYRPIVRISKKAQYEANPGADSFNAYYIPMVQVADVNNGTSHYVLPTGNPQPPIAITSRIDGCVFSLGSDGNGGILASHVQPPRGPSNTHDQRQDQANQLGSQGFGNDLAQVKHGVNYDDAEDKIAVMGRFAGGHWSFYMQTTHSTSQTVRSAIKFVEF
jgi:hypothetical protein